MRCRTSVGIAALFGLLAAMATPARADVQIWVSVNGGAYSRVDTQNTATTAATGSNVSLGGGFTGTLSASSNLPGSPGTSYELGTQNQILAGSAGGTIGIIEVASGYTAPTAPPAILVTSRYSPTLNLGVSGTFQSFADDNYTPVSTAGYTYSGSGATPGSQTVVLNNSTNSATATTLANLLTSPYALVETLSLTFGDSGTLNSSTATILTSTPEPSSMVLAGVGVLGLVGYGLRRRKAMGA